MALLTLVLHTRNISSFRYFPLMHFFHSSLFLPPFNFPVLHIVEFEKRGLPHAVILIWQTKDNQDVSPALIDSFFYAEIPDPVEYPLGYALVSEYMMHGPCMKNGVCSNKFPKSFQSKTLVDEHGFPIYRRHHNGRFVIKNKVRLDNRHVVPYHTALLKKYQSHLNVEWCNTTHVIKYLYKYVTKGCDFSKTLFERIKKVVLLMLIVLMRSRNIGNVVTYVIMMLFGEYVGLIHIVKHNLLRGFLLIC